MRTRKPSALNQFREAKIGSPELDREVARLLNLGDENALPAWTTSLDAARSLITHPEALWTLSRINTLGEEDEYAASISIWKNEPSRFADSAHTAELALCIVALKSRGVR